MTTTDYKADAIEVLKGLDPVRIRPAMYTDTSRPNHIGQEAIDNSVDEAIATDKRALLPGNTATFEIYTSYVHGLNGLMVDIAGTDEPLGLVLPGNFAFHVDSDDVGNDDQPTTWDPAPAPKAISVRPGEGIDGSDRVTITFDDGVLTNTWLRVTVISGEGTGLSEDDVFFFGNAIGESGNLAGEPTNLATVTATDEILARNFRRGLLDRAEIDNPYDFNRDGLVNVADRLIARNHRTDLSTALKLFSPPASGLSSEEGTASTRPNEKAVDLLLASYGL